MKFFYSLVFVELLYQESNQAVQWAWKRRRSGRGRKRTVSTPRNLKNIKKLIDRNPRISMKPIARAIISRNAVRQITKNKLELKLTASMTLQTSAMGANPFHSWEAVYGGINPQLLKQQMLVRNSTIVEYRKYQFVVVWSGICTSNKTCLWISMSKSMNTWHFRQHFDPQMTWKWLKNGAKPIFWISWHHPWNRRPTRQISMQWITIYSEF